MTNQIIEPAFEKQNFTCPFCRIHSEQKWRHSNWLIDSFNEYQTYFFFDYRKNIEDYRQKAIEGFLKNWSDTGSRELRRIELIGKYHIAICQSCREGSVWLNKEMIYPRKSIIEEPNEDLNDDIKKDYNEAREIVEISPKATAALLRLCLQKLCEQLGEKGKNINDDIQSLIKKGLDKSLQQAFDIVRVTGNNAVHPGQIDIDDNKELVYKLFKLINMIAQKMISDKKEINSLYDDLPDSQKRETRGN